MEDGTLTIARRCVRRRFAPPHSVSPACPFSSSPSRGSRPHQARVRRCRSGHPAPAPPLPSRPSPCGASPPRAHPRGRRPRRDRPRDRLSSSLVSSFAGGSSAFFRLRPDALASGSDAAFFALSFAIGGLRAENLGFPEPGWGALGSERGGRSMGILGWVFFSSRFPDVFPGRRTTSRKTNKARARPGSLSVCGAEDWKTRGFRDHGGGGRGRSGYLPDGAARGRSACATRIARRPFLVVLTFTSCASWILCATVWRFPGVFPAARSGGRTSCRS